MVHTPVICRNLENRHLRLDTIKQRLRLIVTIPTIVWTSQGAFGGPRGDSLDKLSGRLAGHTALKRITLLHFQALLCHHYAGWLLCCLCFACPPLSASSKLFCTSSSVCRAWMPNSKMKRSARTGVPLQNTVHHAFIGSFVIARRSYATRHGPKHMFDCWLSFRWKSLVAKFETREGMNRRQIATAKLACGPLVARLSVWASFGISSYRSAHKLSL